MNKTVRKILMFIKRDFLIAASYRLSFLLDAITILASTATFFFVSRLIPAGTSAHLKEFGGDYFSFVLIGLAFSGYLQAALQGFAQTLLHEQSEGTLEILLLSPTKISTLLACGAAAKFTLATLRVAIYFFLGWFIFGFSFARINVLSFLTVLILTVLSFSSLGIISASFIIVLKRGDPVSWVTGGLSRLFGGVFFPVAVLPPILKKVSAFIPLTYSLDGMRKSILLGAGLGDIFPQAAMLALFFAVLFPVGTLSLKKALNKAKRNGSLLYS
ncbi:MAG: ABC transporter permease [Candidatus Omnitrophota bacterium]